MARIIHVADAYDAMTSPRPFRQVYDHETALKQLEDQSAAQFDPQVVGAFRGLEAIALIRTSIAAGISGTCLSPAKTLLDVSQLSYDELLSTIASEPPLTADILRAANIDAANADAAATVKLPVACARLGETRVRAAVARREQGNVGMVQLWEHSLRCATAARLLAEQTRLLDADEAYPLGLLHVIGKILLLSLFPAEMENLLWLSEDGSTDREVAAFGVDHAQVGQWLSDACAVPRALTVAIQAHHDIMRINAPTALLLHVANAIARADKPLQSRP